MKKGEDLTNKKTMMLTLVIFWKKRGGLIKEQAHDSAQI